MDSRHPRQFSISTNKSQQRNQAMSVFPDQKLDGGTRFDLIYPNGELVNGHKFQNGTDMDNSFGGVQNPPNGDNDWSWTNMVPSSSVIVNAEEECQEDCDLSDAALRYIRQMLMEEDMEDKTCMLQESLDLEAKERSFYEVLGQEYPSVPEENPSHIDPNSECPNGYFSQVQSYSGDHLADPIWNNNPANCIDPPQVQTLPAYASSHSSAGSSNATNSTIEGFLDSPISTLQGHGLYNESQSVLQFQKGVEEASKFLPNGNTLLLNLNGNGMLSYNPKNQSSEVAAKRENKDEGENVLTGVKARKNPRRRDVDFEEERSSKQAAVFAEPTVRDEEFDSVLLHSKGKWGEAFLSYRESLKSWTIKIMGPNEQSKGSSGRKGRGGKRRNGKKEVVDLRALLITCAQAVAADDRRSANEMLKQIRQHASPFGDGNQRLAHCFANGLEARLAGTGSQMHKALVSRKAYAADYLKAYHLYLATCPFRKVSNFTANKTIRIKAENAMRVHIIDFGILYGFQWPTFIQRLSEEKEGRIPKIRITGIEFPQPGFRPAERIEETGRRLADYARTFNVPFEYNAIAKKWDNVRVEDLKLEKDEFLVVNCLYRFTNLLDETVAVDSSRNIVLELIKKINPDIFIHGIVNGSYSAPFFVTRFREALFHFSSLFDMLETNVPREHSERMLIERDFFGREALNVIACEGWERVERPETYKQWHVRHLRAGFMQIPFDRGVMEIAHHRVRSIYHKDFVIDEDSHWLLQGWKGRIIYAISCWKPV